MKTKKPRSKLFYFILTPAILVLIIIILALVTDDKNVSPFLYITR